jgi:hypothetical protein
MEDFSFSLPTFSYKWAEREKIIFLSFPFTQRNARTHKHSLQKLSPLVMKPHHHLNCSILKVCENGTKLIFPVSLLSVISVVSLLHCCVPWSRGASLYGNLRYSVV